MAYSADEQKSLDAYSAWFNRVLQENPPQDGKVGVLKIENLLDDLSDGALLVRLCAAIFDRPLPPHNAKPKNHFQKVENLNAGLEMIKEAGVDTTGVQAEDFQTKNPKVVLGICWRIILKTDGRAEKHKKPGQWEEEVLKEEAERKAEEPKDPELDPEPEPKIVTTDPQAMPQSVSLEKKEPELDQEEHPPAPAPEPAEQGTNKPTWRPTMEDHSPGPASSSFPQEAPEDYTASITPLSGQFITDPTQGQPPSECPHPNPLQPSIQEVPPLTQPYVAQPQGGTWRSQDTNLQPEPLNPPAAGFWHHPEMEALPLPFHPTSPRPCPPIHDGFPPPSPAFLAGCIDGFPHHPCPPPPYFYMGAAPLPLPHLPMNLPPPIMEVVELPSPRATMVTTIYPPGVLC